MASISTLAAALRDTINTALTDVDQASIDTYLPAVTTTKIALFVVPPRQRDRYEFSSLSGASMEATHEMQVELWVRVQNGAETTWMARAREVALGAARALFAADGTTYTLAFDGGAPPIEAVADDGFVEVGNVPYLVTRMTVRLRNEISLS